MKIAISGPMCSGKTTVANLICELYPEYKKIWGLLNSIQLRGECTWSVSVYGVA